MQYYGSKEMAASFRTVRNNTIAVAEEIPEDKYSFQATPENRTVAETLVHIARYCEGAEKIHKELHLSTLDGFDFMSFWMPIFTDEKTPRSKAQIVEMLRTSGDRFAGWLESLSDDYLAERVEMPSMVPGPRSKTRFEMLLSVKEHEMHHRGQLMVLQRMTGGVPPLTRAMQERMAQMAAAAKK